MSKYIFETVVFCGRTKVWRVLCVNTGTIYSLDHDSYEEAYNSIEDGQERSGKIVKRVDRDAIIDLLAKGTGLLELIAEQTKAKESSQLPSVSRKHVQILKSPNDRDIGVYGDLLLQDSQFSSFAPSDSKDRAFGFWVRDMRKIGGVIAVETEERETFVFVER